MTELTTTIYFLSGFAVVLIFAINYFNQPGYHFADEGRGIGSEQESLMLEPALPKYLTDRFEYNLYLIAYVMVCEIIFVMLVLFLPDLLSEGAEKTAPLTVTRQNIVLATLIITGIAPNLPFIKKILERSKGYLHDKAQIPRKGRDVYRKLKGENPHYTAERIESVLNDKLFIRSGKNGKDYRPDLDEAEFKLDTWTLGGRWAKLSYLFHYIQEWAKESPFRGYIGNRELRYASIDKSYQELLALKIRHEEGTLSDSESTRMNSYLDATLHRTYRLISCLLYLAVKSDAAVGSYLGQLGYIPEKRQVFSIPWRKLVFMVGAIILPIVVGGLIAFAVTQSGILPFELVVTTNNIFSWTGYAVPFMTLPIVFVLCIKRYLSMRSEAWPVIAETDEKLDLADRPWHIYAIVTLAGYVSGGLILFTSSILVKLKNGVEIEHIQEMLRYSFLWTGIVGVTIAFLAFRLDSTKTTNQSLAIRMLKNTLGALAQGTTSTAAVYIAYVHQYNDGNLNPLNIPEPQTNNLIIYCFIAFIMGLSLYLATGFNIFRQKRRSDRYSVQYPVQIQFEHNLADATIIDISSGGALIECDDIQRRKPRTLQIALAQGKSVVAKIIKRQKNQAHVAFPESESWQMMQEELDLQFES